MRRPPPKPLAELDKRLTTQIVETMDPEKAADILEEMDPDQAADVLAGLTPESSREVLSEMPGEEAREVRELLKFEENSAGGMMNTDFIYVGEAATREEVVAWINEKEVDLEQTGYRVSDRQRGKVLRRGCGGPAVACAGGRTDGGIENGTVTLGSSRCRRQGSI